MTDPPLRYLTGCDSPQARELATTHGVGLMLQPNSYRPSRSEHYPVHAVDNGAFTPPGKPDRFDEARWLRYLDRCPRDRCLFAVAPDVPFDWPASWARSELYIDRVRDMGYRVALAVQNGATPDLVPWDAADVVFLGGDTAWKLSTDALYIARAALDRGVPVHMGRANSWVRLRRAAEMAVDTADGTFLKHGEPEHMAQRLRVMLDHVADPDGLQLALA